MNIEIANRLADLRKQHGYSQEELADKLGVSRQAISKWECGESSPDTDNLIALARVYEMSLDELLGNPVKKEEKQPEPETVDAEVVDPDEDEEDDYDDDIPHARKSVLYSIINGSGALIAAIIYIIIGFAWKGPTGNLGWASGWTLFFIPMIITSIFQCVWSRSPSRFAYPLLVVAVYCDMGIIGGAYGYNLWHPYWFLFITIPIFYVVAHSIERARKK